LTKKILIVDDDSSIRYTVKSGLETYDDNYQVFTCGSGFECIEFLENNKLPDLILLDIMMPGMSGWATYDKIKENDMWKNIPIVFLTARTDKVAKKAGDILGDEYIEKPAQIPQIKEKIEKLLK
jgi:CheY-like chemotaxis protein